MRHCNFCSFRKCALIFIFHLKKKKQLQQRSETKRAYNISAFICGMDFVTWFFGKRVELPLRVATAAARSACWLVVCCCIGDKMPPCCTQSANRQPLTHPHTHTQARIGDSQHMRIHIYAPTQSEERGFGLAGGVCAWHICGRVPVACSHARGYTVYGI